MGIQKGVIFPNGSPRNQMGISLFLTILMAILVGVFIPASLNRIKKDPAIGTGPFATILRDILSLVIYFSVAIVLPKLFEAL